MIFDKTFPLGKGIKTRHRNEAISLTDEIQYMVNRWKELESIKRNRAFTNYENRKYKELLSNEKFQKYLSKQN